MTLIRRFTGVFAEPKPVFRFLAEERPIWVDALILILVAVAAFSLLAAPYARQDQIEMFRDNVRMKERLGEEGFQRYLDRLENPSSVQTIVQTVVAAPVMTVIGFLVSALFIFILGRFVSTSGAYVQVLAALVHAAFIDKILGSAVRTGLVLASGSAMKTTTSLALLFPRLEITSPLFMALAQVDFFQIWMFGVLAYGLAAAFQVELKKALYVSYGFWLLKALFGFALGSLFASFVG